MTKLLLASGLIGEWLSCFQEMPAVPGKTCLYLLIVLSAASWSIILSKLLLLHRVKKVDLLFKSHLRLSKNCLEVYEARGNYAPSLLFEVYNAGARAAAQEMAGLEDPRYLIENNLSTQGSLNLRQLQTVEIALEDGERHSVDLLRVGFKCLKLISIAAPVLAALGASWLLIAGFWSEGDLWRRNLGYALLVIWGSLLVAGPAGMIRVYLLNQCRARVNQLCQFRVRMFRVFEDSFVRNQR